VGTVPYLYLASFRLITLVPADFIDEIEQRTPGWIDQRLIIHSAHLDSRLTKRYDAPFKPPYPVAVTEWVAKLAALDCWLRRGVAATDEQFLEFKEQATTALADIKEAADSETGLFDLPLRANTDASGVTRGFPRGYSEQSPYVWTNIQGRIGRSEDQNT
jgi:hypothetical protein